MSSAPAYTLLTNSTSTPFFSNATSSQSSPNSACIYKSTVHVTATITITAERPTLITRTGKTPKTTHITTTITVTKPKASATGVAGAGIEDSEDSSETEDGDEESDSEEAEGVHADANADADTSEGGDYEATEEEDEEVSTTFTESVKSSANPNKAPSDTTDEGTAALEARVDPAHKRSITPQDIPYCITMANINFDVKYSSVDAQIAGPDGRCTPPPTYTGLPYASNPWTPPPPLASSTLYVISTTPASTSFSKSKSRKTRTCRKYPTPPTGCKGAMDRP